MASFTLDHNLANRVLTQTGGYLGVPTWTALRP
jgi:hypothetical protein